jgi:hypothetical protein
MSCAALNAAEKVGQRYAKFVTEADAKQAKSFLEWRGESGGESRWVKLDPIKKIPELMEASLPTAINVSRKGPATLPLTVC